MLTQRLRHRITIQRPVLGAQDSTGAQPLTWESVLADEPAEVVPKSAREFNASQAVQSEVSGRITIRKPAITIESSMRIVWHGLPYQIDGVLPDPSDRRWLTLIYSQGVNDGQ